MNPDVWTVLYNSIRVCVCVFVRCVCVFVRCVLSVLFFFLITLIVVLISFELFRSLQNMIKV